MKTIHLFLKTKPLALLLCACTSLLQPHAGIAQKPIGNSDGSITLPLQDMSAFRPAAGNWQIVGKASADPTKATEIATDKGKGILVNKPSDKNKDNLVTMQEHGDLDLELDFMIAKGANSGIYLQGRYEIQLLDSWGVKNPSVHDCGAIYERWDDSKPEGQKGYEGYAPRTNASRAPGLWQHLTIQFQAPRFDAQGKKTENAKVLLISLNGVTIHENVELAGPTRGPMSPQETAQGPLLIQGDHGPIALRNIRYKNYSNTPLTINNLRYSYYEKYDRAPDFSRWKADSEGKATDFSWDIGNGKNQFTVRYTGTLPITEAGQYRFSLATSGYGSLKVGNKATPIHGRGGQASVMVEAGQQPMEIVYGKTEAWENPELSLLVEGPGIRQQSLLPASLIPIRNVEDPILLTASDEPTLLRSFMDYWNAENDTYKRITHAISVGNPLGLHYTMDLDNGALVQVWRGGFLNTTPMWHDRGDGSSRPMGSVLTLNDAPVLTTLGNTNAAWPDTLGNEAAYRFKGYDLDENGLPIFKYTVYGKEVEDFTAPDLDGKMLSRTIRVSGPNSSDLYIRLATGKAIEALADGSYAINDKQYYLQLTDAAGAKPLIRNVNNRQELLIPVSGTDKGKTIKYAIMW